MVNVLCMNIQERMEVLSSCTGKEAETDLLSAEEAVRDANFTISVLPVLYEAWHSPYKNSKLQHRLENVVEEISEACSREMQTFTQLILDTVENLCPKVLQKPGVREELINTVSGKMIHQENTMAVNLDHIVKDILNQVK
ncbi:hypothetical protein FKM82_003503 [Ascaphus truei]